MTDTTRPPAPRSPLDILADLRAEHAAGTISTTAFLARVAELQAACIGASPIG